MITVYGLDSFFPLAFQIWWCGILVLHLLLCVFEFDPVRDDKENGREEALFLYLTLHKAVEK